jgi:hypothetical protein
MKNAIRLLAKALLIVSGLSLVVAMFLMSPSAPPKHTLQVCIFITLDIWLSAGILGAILYGLGGVLYAKKAR